MEASPCSCGKELTELIITVGADVNAKSTTDETPLDVAACGVSSAIGELLMAKGVHISSIHAAAYLGDLTKVEDFLNEGVEVDKKSGMIEITALHSAAAAGHKEMVAFLIGKGSDVNAQNGPGQTPLHMAAEAGHLDVVRLLLDRDVDINAKNKRGRTPADLAQEAGHTKIVELLRKQTLVHDVAVANISVPLRCVSGDTIPVVMAIHNQGNYGESLQVRLTDVTENKDIGTQSVRLSARYQSAIHADMILTGEVAATTQYGNHIEEITDINGDGYGDILAGGGSRWNSNRGRCYLYYGGPDMDDKPDKIFTGENKDDYFAEYIATGDINKDNYSDVIVGAPGYATDMVQESAGTGNDNIGSF